MKTVCEIAGACVFMLAVAACGSSPTAWDAAAVVGPSYDGGFGMGSGNRDAPADSTIDHGSTTNSDSTGRGGFGVGSGN